MPSDYRSGFIQPGRIAGFGWHYLWSENRAEESACGTKLEGVRDHGAGARKPLGPQQTPCAGNTQRLFDSVDTPAGADEHGVGGTDHRQPPEGLVTGQQICSQTWLQFLN